MPRDHGSWTNEEKTPKGQVSQSEHRGDRCLERQRAAAIEAGHCWLAEHCSMATTGIRSPQVRSTSYDSTQCRPRRHILRPGCKQSFTQKSTWTGFGRNGRSGFAGRGTFTEQSIRHHFALLKAPLRRNLRSPPAAAAILSERLVADCEESVEPIQAPSTSRIPSFNAAVFVFCDCFLCAATYLRSVSLAQRLSSGEQ